MLKLAVVLMVCAATAPAWTDSVSYRFPAEGIENIGVWCGRMVMRASIRADTGTSLRVRCFTANPAETTGRRTADVEISGLGPEQDDMLATIMASCSAADSYPRCSLDIRLPLTVGVLTDLNSQEGSHVRVDGLRGMARVSVFGGDLELLNHCGPADVYGMKVVATILDQRPGDTLRLDAWDNLTLYYPDSIPADVRAPVLYSPDITGLTVSYAHGYSAGYTLNPKAPGPARYINLVRGGRVRPLAAYEE